MSSTDQPVGVAGHCLHLSAASRPVTGSVRSLGDRLGFRQRTWNRVRAEGCVSSFSVCPAGLRVPVGGAMLAEVLLLLGCREGRLGGCPRGRVARLRATVSNPCCGREIVDRGSMCDHGPGGGGREVRLCTLRTGHTTRPSHRCSACLRPTATAIPFGREPVRGGDCPGRPGLPGNSLAMAGFTGHPAAAASHPARAAAPRDAAAGEQPSPPGQSPGTGPDPAAEAKSPSRKPGLTGRPIVVSRISWGTPRRRGLAAMGFFLRGS